MDSPSRLKNFIRHIKHWLIVKTAPRQNRIYTQFYRFPHQYQALVERVVPQMLNARESPLRILVFGCCSGAEPISLSAVLHRHFPQLEYRIEAFDLVPSVIERAQNPCYSRDEVYQGPFVREDFVGETFDIEDGVYRVKPEILQPISFHVGDMLDENFIAALGQADLVFAQNVLFHLPATNARRAFANLQRLLHPGAALFINGMDTEMRVQLTKKFQLQPEAYLIEEIHNDARQDRGDAWAGAYWGRKPFTRRSREWIREHCTIYRKASV
ncbi:methyltransferase domain-containing protein [Microbulbifer bruguierae]|uniref:Methyltransferase domain-containing protein n=1 Tax=Microbulbifer bruguierae TaxID=3029061 RepID=A0ABY8NHD3_9GAMM|nr:CheR family methyltransferase [Microbulbifer bruguierae]WGL18223.1 methyltransferase domain-containing protein [Microbulbifer bruguierae]